MIDGLSKKTAAALLAAALAGGVLTLSACSSGSNSNSSGSSSSSANTEQVSSSSASMSSSSTAAAEADYITEADPDSPYAKGVHHVKLTVDGYDPVTIEVNADDAPVSTWNFCRLVEDGFYDGLSFYRFVDGFCMQGGSSNYSAAADPDSDADHIVGEFAYNGIDNPLADNFKKGTVAMARSSDKNSADTTFFVTLSSGANVSASLNKNYAAFGTIDEDGMKVVDQIVADYLGNVDDSSSGSISSKDKQAIISSAEVID